MRIISGDSGRQRLHSAKIEGVRPTSDKVREALFSILSDAVEGQNVLDLFAGFGTLGLESLSRGAAHVSFVEKSPAAAGIIQKNVQKLGLINADVYVMDVFKFLSSLGKKKGPFGLIFADPPYALFDHPWIRELWPAVGHVLAEGGRFVLEHPGLWNSPEMFQGMQSIDKRKYGQTHVSIYLKPGPAV
jgi:16S rRNA (guanine966-N2)-methyltransferase